MWLFSKNEKPTEKQNVRQAYKEFWHRHELRIVKGEKIRLELIRLEPVPENTERSAELLKQIRQLYAEFLDEKEAAIKGGYWDWPW